MVVETEYGACRVRTDHYKKGHKPTIETAVNKNNYFGQQARAVHGNTYDYGDVVYINAKTKIKVVCGVHGVFEINPQEHLNGVGCPVCYNEQRE